MSVWKAYLSPLNPDGSYKEYQEITKYVVGDAIGSIKLSTESSEYDVGIAVNNSLNLKLNNSSGLFSERGAYGSVFEAGREGAKVKIAYLFGQFAPIVGQAVCGLDVLGPEITAFEGFLTEKNAKQDVIQDTISFTVLGKLSILDKIETTTTGITTSSTISSAIYTILNRTQITDLFTVDIANINPTIDPTLGTINGDASLDYLKDKTTKEALDILVESSASVLYIEDDVIYVTDRSPNDDVQFLFYGQASNFGLENIQNISGYTTGINRTFNFWKWKDTNLTSKSTSSIETYGVLKHEELDFEATTDNTARQTLLDTYKTEFSIPKIEMSLSTRADVETLALKLFDKVAIDYPNIAINSGVGNLPVWNTGSMIWRDPNTFDPSLQFFTWPDGLFNIEIDINQEWKIIGINTDSKKDLITFKLREV